MRPSRAAWTASCTVEICSSLKILRAVLGPIPGTCMTATAPGGLRAITLSSAAIEPVARSSVTLSLIVTPMLGSSTSLPCSESRATDSGVSRSVLAARR